MIEIILGIQLCTEGAVKKQPLFLMVSKEG